MAAHMAKIVDMAGAPPRKSKAPRNKAGSSMKQGYRFVDKDPIIDYVMSIFNQTELSYEQLAWAAGMSPSTIRNWDLGKTRHPQHNSVVRVLLALGHEYGVHQFGTVGEMHRSPSTAYYEREIKGWQRSRQERGGKT